MELKTASAVLSFARKLEEDSTQYYKEIVGKFNRDNDVFLSFIKENERNINQAERAYYGVISDALEGCFSFVVETGNYELNSSFAKDSVFRDLILQLIENEKKIISFYTDAANQSKPFLAEVPRVFLSISKGRQKRLVTLEAYTL